MPEYFDPNRIIAPAQERPTPMPQPAPPKPTYKHARKPHYSSLKGMSPDRVKQLCARILDWVQRYGDHNSDGHPFCNKRALERGLHSNRAPDDWQAAVRFLVQRKVITVSGHNVTVIDLLYDERLPDPFDPLGKKQAIAERWERKASRRKRPLSKWVTEKILERGGTLPSEGWVSPTT